MAHAIEKGTMKRSADRRPAAIFDINHGRRLHRLRPDLAQGAACARDGERTGPRRAHALDRLWEETQGEAPAVVRGRRRSARSAAHSPQPLEPHRLPLQAVERRVVRTAAHARADQQARPPLRRQLRLLRRRQQTRVQPLVAARAERRAGLRVGARVRCRPDDAAFYCLQRQAVRFEGLR